MQEPFTCTGTCADFTVIVSIKALGGDKLSSGIPTPCKIRPELHLEPPNLTWLARRKEKGEEKDAEGEGIHFTNNLSLLRCPWGRKGARGGSSTKRGNYLCKQLIKVLF